MSDDLPSQLVFLSFFAIAQSYYISGDYNFSLELINKAIGQLELLTINQLPDGASEAYFLQGHHYRMIGDYEKAVVSYSKTIEINPKMPLLI